MTARGCVIPLTPKGEKILAAMRKQYGDKDRAERIFYASANANKITGVHEDQARRFREAIRRRLGKKG